MNGRDVALATLMREKVTEPCMTFCWMTSSSYMSYVAGSDYWADPEGVFYEYIRLKGINFVPQNYRPGEAHHNLEQGKLMHDVQPVEWDPVAGLETVLRTIDELPPDSRLEAEFNIEEAAKDYAESIRTRTERTDGEVLFIEHYGQADFMGGYGRWGYENYLAAIALYPDAMQRYYHHTALAGRLYNEAIVYARDKYGIAPFVYSGQDICGAKGPMASPEILRQIYFPELKWSMEPLVDNGFGIIWHCDGDIMPILDDLLDLGIDGMQGFEEEHGVRYDDIVKLENKAGKPLAVWGCVSVTSTLPHGTPDDVRSSVERSFKLAGPGRGFVLSSTSSVLPEVPHENIDALFDWGKKFGREFLSA